MQQHPLRINASSFVNFCFKLDNLRKNPCLCVDGQEHCVTIKVPGDYGISALACGQGRGLEQQQCSGSLLGVSRVGDLMPSNPLTSLNMTSADRE